MFAVNLICVGTLKEAYWRGAFAEYCKRLSKWCRFRLTEIQEEKLPDNPSDSQIAAALDREALRILPCVPPRAAVIPLCVEGRQIGSEGFAGKLSRMMVEGSSSATFIIGSSFGLSHLVKEKADFAFSISVMTFPHQLARVMLMEQLYRAFSIINGGKYNK